MNILVVDNDKDTIETFKAILDTESDYRMDAAYSGNEAIEKMGADRFDLVILDIMMPKISGIDVCKAMVKNEEFKRIPVLLVSALPVASQAFRDSLGKFNELSVVKDVLEKPFTSDELITKIKAAIGK